MNKLTKILLIALMTVTLLLLAAACSGNTENPKDTTSETVTDENGSPVTAAPGEDTTPAAPGDDTSAGDTSAETTPAEPAAIVLTFSGTKLTSTDNTAVTVDAEANAFVITKGGIYELKGDMSNGQLRVQADKAEEVTLIFNNFTASSSKSAPLYVISCDKCIIDLADGSVNRLSDASVYQYPDANTDKPNACLYSSDDLTIKGHGSLIIEGNYNNGIGCKNDVKIKNGTITISAPNNIIKGNESVTICGGNVTLSGGEDAIKADSDKEGKGFILISEDAVVSITCGDDAIQASQSVTVEAGTKVTVHAGGDPVNCPGVINVAEGALITE